MNAAKNTQGTLEEQSVTLGREAGVNAAEWWLQESPIGGRSSAGLTEARVWAADMLERMNDGDPAVYDSFPVVDLSGEWADGWTPKRLAEELGMDDDSEAGDDLDALCDAFEEGAHAGVSETIEAALVEAAQASR